MARRIGVPSAFVCLAAAALVSAPAFGLSVTASRSQVTGFIGSSTGKLVFVDNDDSARIKWIDIADSSLTVHTLSSDAGCNNVILHTDGDRLVYQRNGKVYARKLSGGGAVEIATIGTLRSGGCPFWYTQGGTDYVVYCDSTDKGSYGSGDTYQQQMSGINKSGSRTTICSSGAYDGGRTGNGTWLCEAYGGIHAYNIGSGKTYSTFYKSDGSAEGQCCNAARVPDSTNRMLTLVLPHTYFRVWQFDSGQDRWEEAKTFTKPSGTDEWQTPEWSTSSSFITATGKDSGGKYDLYMVKYSNKSTLKVLDGNIGNHHLCVGGSAPPPVNPPSVATNDASNVGTTTARLNGNLTSTGGENPTVKIYWGDNNAGTTAGNWDHVENLGTKGTGTFYKDVSGLTPNKTYYFRCYASNSGGGTWASATKSFTTDPQINAPAVSTNDATNVGTTTARLNGNLTSTGGENPTVKIYWGDNNAGTTAGNWDHVENLGTKGTGTFYKNVSGLTPNKTYYFRCYASNSGGGSWASSGKSFTTDQQVSAPGVTTKDATNITTSAARLNGELTSTGNENPTVKVYWGDNNAGTTAGNWDHEENLGTRGTGTFYKDVTGLASGTTYYARCYASNSAGGTWASSTKSFTTADPANASPSASIGSPSDGATFTAGEALSYNGSASDPEDGTLSGGSLLWEIDRIGDGLGAVHTSTGTSDNYTFPSDLAADTTYYVTLTATDSGGATATDSHTITVSPIPSSDQPCSVDITTPSNNATVSGSVAVNAVAYDPDVGSSDGDGILSVVFELRSGSTVVASHQENAVTYDWSIDTTAYADGSYALRAVATSTAAAGGTQATDEIQISISNGGGGGGGVTIPLRINCGDNAYDVAGWERDDTYVNGNDDYVSPSDVDTTGVANAAPAMVYKSVAHRDHDYDIPVPDGTYTLRMHFVDHYTGRDMTYTVEGQVILDHFDIASEAGGTDRALVRDFVVTVADGNGMQILCSGNGGDVFEAGLEILAGGSAAHTLTILSLSGDQLAGKQDVTVTWTSDVPGSVRVEFTDDGWSSSTVVAASTANDGSHTWQVANTDSIDCYVRVSDAADGDPADVYGPFSVSAIADADGDRIDDAWEIEHFGDTSTTDGSADSDDDGVTDLEEFWTGMDPMVPDAHVTDAFSCTPRSAGGASALLLLAGIAALLAGARSGRVVVARRSAKE